MARRLPLLLLSLLLPTLAGAAIRLGPPRPVGDGTTTPGGAGVTMRAVATSWGYLAVWDRDGIVAARLNPDGTLVDDPPFRIGTQQRLLAQPATDGNDVIVAHGEFVARRPVWQVKRVSPEGEVTHLRTINDLLGIVWTGRSYLALLGNCTPREAMLFDRDGNILQSVAIRIPFRNCDELASSVYRDPSGALQLVFQDPLASSTGDYSVRRVALTDANGNPLADPQPVLLGITTNGNIRGVAATDRVVYVLTSGTVYLVDHAGRAVAAPVQVGATAGAIIANGGEAIVAATMPGGTIRSWRITPDGRRFAMGTGQNSPVPKDELTVVPAPGGAAVFWIERDATANRATVLTLQVTRGPRGRFNLPVAVSRGTPQVRDLRAAAHGDGMLVVWQQFGVLGAEVRSVLIDSSGRPAGPSRHVANADSVRMVSSGDVAMLVMRRGSSPWFAQRLDRSGARLGEPVPLPLLVRDVYWDGSAFVVYFQQQHSAMRIDPAGVVLGEPVKLVDANQFAAAAPAFSPHGALYAVTGLPIPNDYYARVFVQPFTRELRPVAGPRELAIFVTAEMAAVWSGNEYWVALNSDGIRVFRVDRDGVPLDDAFGQFVADADPPAPWRLAAAGNRVLVATPAVVTDVRTGESAALAGVASFGSIVTTRDQRTWLFYVAPDSAAFARELIFE